MFIEAITAWESIEEDERYEVSTNGDVRRLLKDGTYRKLSPSTASSGHKYISVYNGGSTRRHVYIHIAVLRAFGGKRRPGMFALHRDDDPSNNRISNLMWGDRSLNQRHAIANSRKAGRRLTPDSVRHARRIHADGRSLNSIARELDVSRKTIADAVTGATWKDIE